MAILEAEKYETAATIQLDEYYEGTGIKEGWDRARVERLCAWWSITPQELGKLFLVEFQDMNRMLKADRFPPVVALHFAMLESFYMERVLGVKQKPVVPVDLILG